MKNYERYTFWQNFLDNLMAILCFVVVVIIFLAIVAGGATLFVWLFNPVVGVIVGIILFIVCMAFIETIF
jgi:hypothetical protein